MNPLPNHPCPCCGYRTYRQPAGGTMQICPVCFWEDAPGEAPWNTSNSATLLEAQQNFSEFGASGREFTDVVRPPFPGEDRLCNWLTFHELSAAIISLVEEAFGKVSLGNGITIHQREAINAYQSEIVFQDARRLDNETCWQEIPDEKIEKIGTTLTFLDAESVRYHLPAFMRFALKGWAKVKCFGTADLVLYSLDSGPRSNGYHAESFLELNDSQHQAVAAFLKFVALVDPVYGDDASRGLTKGWEAWLPDSLHFPYHTSSQS